MSIRILDDRNDSSLDKRWVYVIVAIVLGAGDTRPSAPGGGDGLPDKPHEAVASSFVLPRASFRCCHGAHQIARDQRAI
jgi:hypothetical protein